MRYRRQAVINHGGMRPSLQGSIMHGLCDQAYEIIAVLWRSGVSVSTINNMIRKGIDLRGYQLKEAARYNSSALQKSEAVFDLGYRLDSGKIGYEHSIEQLRIIESSPQISVQTKS